MCGICNKTSKMSNNPSDYYFSCFYDKDCDYDDNDEEYNIKYYPLICLTPKEYFDYHNCFIDIHLDIDYKWINLKYATMEGEYCWGGEKEDPTILDMYNNMIYMGFIYNSAYVDYVAADKNALYEYPDNNNKVLTSKMIDDRK